MFSHIFLSTFLIGGIAGIVLWLWTKIKNKLPWRSYALSGTYQTWLEISTWSGIILILIAWLKGAFTQDSAGAYLLMIGILLIVGSWIVALFLKIEIKDRKEKALQQKREQEAKEKMDAMLAEENARLAAEEADRQARMEAYHEEIQRKIEAERLERERFKGLLSSIPKYEITVNPSATKQNINVSDFYLEYSSLRKNMNLSRVSSFVAIDTETTGLVPGRNKIVQISAIRFEGFEPTEIFTTYINPDCPIPPESTSIHGITDDMVADSPKFEHILDSLEEFIGSSTLVGHNLQFDLKFLRKFGYDSLKINRSYFDTLTLSRMYDDEIENHKLYRACQEHGIYYTAHDSSEDALASGLLFIKYLKMKVGDLF